MSKRTPKNIYLLKIKTFRKAYNEVREGSLQTDFVQYQQDCIEWLNDIRTTKYMHFMNLKGSKWKN